MKEFKSNLKEEIDTTQNPLVQSSRRVVDVAFSESGLARAIKEMQKYDRDFDLQDLHYEAEEIFKEFYCNFLNGNLDYVEKVCGKAGLAIAKTEIKRRQTEGWKYKYDDILNINHPNFLGGQIPDKSPPQFSFTIEVQEIDCKVNVKDGSIKDGGEDRIIESVYRIVLSRHDNPDLETTGHYWEIVEFNKVGELQRLVWYIGNLYFSI